MIDEEKIKNSFKKVKEDIDGLNGQLGQFKALLEEIRDNLKVQKEPLKSEDPASPEEDFEPISTGNEGVLSKQINKQANKQINKQTPQSKQISKQTNIPDDTRNFGIFEGLEGTFKSLTRQEFHIFLLIYQLEDEGLIPTYNEISIRLPLTLSCLRAHLCSLIKKGAPIIKNRLKNNSITLSIDRDFKSIASQQKLADFYYSITDPNQTKLPR